MFAHPDYQGVVTISGNSGHDAKSYQENQSGAQFGKSRVKAIDRYHKWVEWSDEDGVYIGRCPDLITGIHGDDPVQVYEELCEVIAAVIDDFETRGQPLPDPRVRPVLHVR